MRRGLRVVQHGHNEVFVVLVQELIVCLIAVGGAFAELVTELLAIEVPYELVKDQQRASEVVPQVQHDPLNPLLLHVSHEFGHSSHFVSYRLERV